MVAKDVRIKPVKYLNSSSWALPELQEADRLGILKSVDGTNFSSRIIRKDFCALVVDMCESSLGKEMPVSAVNPFKDVKDEAGMNYDSILKAYDAGIISGTGAARFDPSLPISREQMAAMMYRASRFLKPGLSYGKGISFSDSKEFNSWSVDAIKAMSAFGIVKGTNGAYQPREYVTVEQACAMVLRLFKKIR